MWDTRNVFLPHLGFTFDLQIKRNTKLMGKGIQDRNKWARNLCTWIHKYLVTRKLPTHCHGQHLISILDDEDFTQDICYDFPLYFTLLVMFLTYFSYHLASLLLKWTISHHSWHIWLLIYLCTPFFAYLSHPSFSYKYQPKSPVHINLFLPLNK